MKQLTRKENNFEFKIDEEVCETDVSYYEVPTKIPHFKKALHSLETRCRVSGTTSLPEKSK